MEVSNVITVSSVLVITFEGVQKGKTVMASAVSSETKSVIVMPLILPY